VVIPAMTQYYAMLQSNLLYTGVTCGKRLVVLVGQNKADAIAVRNVSGRRRWSKLAEWLSGGCLQASVCIMSGVTAPAWWSRFDLASEKVGNKLRHFKHAPGMSGDGAKNIAA
jgi:hypothetical protein